MRLRTALTLLAFLPALASPPASLAGEVVREDAMGRSVTLRLPASRLVSLSPSVTEIIFAVGAGDRLAGVSKHCDYPVAAKLKAKAGDFNSPDLQAVEKTAPDLVLFTEYARTADLEALEKMGVAAFVIPAGSLADIPAAAVMIGEITGREEAAAGLAAGLEREFEVFRQRFGALPDADRPRVYVEVDGPARLYAVGPGSFMDDVLTLAGGRNVFADRESPYFPVDPDAVVAADPEIILIDHPFQYKVGLSKRAGWEKIRAVRSGRVYDGTDYDIILFNRPGPRIISSLREISALLHPGETP